jgi:mono/diheme cytochrome c family protein
MTFRWIIVTGTAVLLAASAAAGASRQGTAAQAAAAGLVLPADAEEKKNPHPVDDKLLAAGQAVYKDKCLRCHGPGGLGDGPDADPDAMDMNLTLPERAERNPDGVMFYKVWNGRKRPKMPAFNTELTEDQVWAVVAYTQSLRKK